MIVAIGASVPALAAAKAAAPTVPMVFATGSDAFEVGLVQSPNRPDGNVAGTSVAAAGLASRRLEMLLELVQRRNPIGYLDNPLSPEVFEANVADLTATARDKGRDLVVFDAATEHEVKTAFTNMALRGVRALIVSPDPFLTMRQEQIIALAELSALPTIYATRGAVMLGGLMSYGVPTNDIYRVAGIYAGRILNGATPAESPVALSTRSQLVINNKTAKALRIALPRRLQIRADEIID